LVHADEVMTVIREFVQNLGLDGGTCKAESELRSLGIDSLQAVDLVFQLEEHFGIQIPMEQFNAKTVGDAIEFVIGILQEK
jgi:acyl carrier protein/nodulation protein F